MRKKSRTPDPIPAVRATLKRSGEKTPFKVTDMPAENLPDRGELPPGHRWVRLSFATTIGQSIGYQSGTVMAGFDSIEVAIRYGEDGLPSPKSIGKAYAKLRAWSRLAIDEAWDELLPEVKELARQNR